MANQSGFHINFWNRLIKFIISPIDNLVATPVNNGVFIGDLETRQAYPGPDANDPYPSINSSINAPYIKESVLSLAILSILAAIIVNSYKKLRKKESHSHYFFFEKLPNMEAWLKNHVHENGCSPESLLASAYFYNPDLSPWALWWRRSWAWLTRNRNYLAFQSFLEKEALKEKTKKDILRETHKEILESVALYITEQQKYGHWIVKEKTNGNLIIQAAENTKDFSNQILRTFKELQNKTQENTTHQKKSVGQKILDFIEARLDELGIASYAYWIGVFAFYFLGGIGVIGSVVWPPILIAGIVLLLLLTTKVYQSMQTKPSLNKLEENELVLQEEKNTHVLLETIQHQIQLEALSKKKIRFKNSKLKKSIEKTLRRERDVNLVWPIFNGFIKGLFTVLFSSWLLTAALGLVVTLNPVGAAIIAIVTLTLGTAYGLYAARKNYQTNHLQITNREKLWRDLNELYKDQDIPDISLEEFDRLLRRHSTDKTLWTSIKQFFKRTWIGFSRVGTGILFVKLTGLGTATSILLALGMTASAAFLPTLAILLTAGLIFAAWHIYQYQLESQQNKIDNVIQSLTYQSLIESNMPKAPEKNLCHQDLQTCLKPDFTERSKSNLSNAKSLSDGRSRELNQEPELFSQENLINVSTQNNFCGYYVLARRIIHDENLGGELLDKFNRFYQTYWNQEQLAEVVKNMHPVQADAMLGLVLYDQRKLGVNGEGLLPDELDTICKDFGYDLYLFEWTKDGLPANFNLANFTPQSQSSHKEIFVLFTHPEDPQKLGHYYLVEPDDTKATIYASQKGLSENDYLYTINNMGAHTEEFIQHIKLSVRGIDQQINLSSASVSRNSSVASLLQDEENNDLTTIPPFSKNLPDSNENEKLKNKSINRFLQKDESLAWKFAVAEAEHHEPKKTFHHFKQLFFFQADTKGFDRELANQEKEYVRELQSKAIKFCNSEMRKKLAKTHAILKL